MHSHRRLALVAIALAIAIPAFVFTQTGSNDASVSQAARQLHDRAIVVDSHDDTPQRMLFEKGFDIGARHANGNIDIPRMREGGLDALFFSIWVPSDVTGPPAVKRSLDLIDAVREAVRTHPNDLVLATTAADIRRAAAEHKIAALMGMEGGHMIDDDLRLLRDYAALGFRLAASSGTAFAAMYKAVRQSYECLAKDQPDPFLGPGGGDAMMKAAQATCGLDRLLEIERRTMKG